jgi:hypothetical protein
VNTKPQEPAAKPAIEQERYMPGDPIPVPHAEEANSESAWALFSDVQHQPEPDFLDTVPASVLEEQQALNAPPVPPKPRGG